MELKLSSSKKALDTFTSFFGGQFSSDLDQGSFSSTMAVPQSSAPMRFGVGEGMENVTEVLPGPRKSTVEALRRGEDVKITPVPRLVSQAGQAKQAVQGQIQIARTEPTGEPEKQIVKDILRAPVKTVLSLGLSASGKKEYQAKDAFSRFLLGDEAVKPMEKTLAGYTETAETIARRFETPEQRKKTDFWSTVGRLPAILPAALAGGTLEALNIELGIGGMKKKAGEKIAEQILEETAEQLLKREARPAIQKAFQEAIEKGIEKPISFGFIPRKQFEAINVIRQTHGVPLLENEEIYLFPNVAKKLREKRILGDKISPQDLTDLAFSAIHSKDSRVFATSYPHIQTLVKPEENLSRIAFVGREKDTGLTSLKSVYPKGTEKLKNTLGGRGVPPSGYVQPSVGQGIRQPPLSDLQGISSASIPASRESVKSTFYNWDRLVANPTNKKIAEQEVAAITPKIEKSFGRTLTHAEVEKTAQESAKILEEVSSRQDTARKIALDLNLRRKLADAVQQGRIDSDFIDLWMKEKSYSSDIARQLEARKIEATPREFTVIDTMLEGIHEVEKDASKIAEAAKGVDFNDAKQATEFYRKFVKPKVGDWLDLIRYNSMLSSPLTHIINITSNAAMSALVAPVEKIVTGGVDAVLNALSLGKRGRTRFAKEGTEYLKGYFSAPAVKKATQDFFDVMRGKKLVENLDLRNIPMYTKGVPYRVERVLSYPVKALEGMDRFFSALTESGAKRGFEFRKGRGVITEGIEEKARAEATKRLFRSKTGLPEQGEILDAIDRLTNLIQAGRNSKNFTVSQIFRFTFPFIQTPMNILKQGIEYSPLGFSTLVGAKNKTEQLSKAIMGSVAAAGAATLLGTGRLTWREPSPQNKRNAWREAGIQQYSVKIGNDYVSFEKLPPLLGFNLAMISAINDAQKNKGLRETQVDVLLNGLAKYQSFFMDQSYVKQMGDLLSAAQGDELGWTRAISNVPQQMIPFRALLGWINNVVDPVQRQADPKGGLFQKQLQQILAQMPLASKAVPSRKTELGREIKKQNPLLNMFSPFRISTENEAPAERIRQEEKMTQKTKPYRQEGQEITDEKQQEALRIHADLSSLPKEEANAKLQELDDETYNRIKKMIQKEKSTPGSAQIRSLGVENGERARFIWDETSKMKTREEKNAWISQLDSQGLISNDVYDQLVQLKNKETNQ